MQGFELLFINVLKGFGIEPEEILGRVNSLVLKVETSLDSFDKRLSRIEKALNILSEDDEKMLTLSNDDKIAEALADNVK